MTLNYYDKIRKIRESKGYKQEFVADQLNITQRTYSNIESGKTQLTVERLIEIVRILDTSLPEIFEYEGNKILNNNFNDTSTKNKGGNLICKNEDFEEQKKLYERIISIKDEEISFLKECLRK
ncbi:helix-turn-helix transcriptional regulator [Capnocytophaga canimorsus]|uniref:helix-turn-helix transcriptional regulator n=1 Tax=Capnocytophaga canimorsus TaxID=28188 RepID=UPI000F6F516A|nr:helix-turn-helix domain-containing protein [Capnocytophaga canimorsus]VEJ19585.1 transcriptional regulator, y4mF family [Capnocytophaga canimorsus]